MAQEAHTEIQPIVQCSPIATAPDTFLNFFTVGGANALADKLCSNPFDQMLAATAFLPKAQAKDRANDQANDQAKDQVPPASKSPVEAARDHLNELAENMVAAKLMKPKDGDRFKADMATFETRAAQAGVSAGEITQTYQNIGRLIEFSGQSAIDQLGRVKVAEQALHHAAIPTLIDQGRHDTCNVTTVEVRAFSRNPAAATRLIADVATAGSTISADGTKITIDAKSLKADEESSQNPTPDRDRSYASQIFQITAANIYWQRQETDPNGNYATQGSLRFEQDPSKRSYFGTDTGERLMAYWSNPPKELAKGPAMGASALKDTFDQITGTNDDGFVIENKIKGGPNTVQVSSEQELKDVLINLKRTGHFPAIIRVHTGNEPFLSDQGGSLSRSKGVWHVVSITAFDEQSGKVWIDNQWGKSSDHVIKLSELYNATLEPKGNAWQMMHESTMPTLHWPLHWSKPSTLLPENELWLH